LFPNFLPRPVRRIPAVGAHRLEKVDAHMRVLLVAVSAHHLRQLHPAGEQILSVWEVGREFVLFSKLIFFRIFFFKNLYIFSHILKKIRLVFGDFL
jgi:hypothetical protein